MRGEGYTVDGCDLQMGGCVVLIVRESARTGVVEGHGAGMQIEESEVCVLTRARENVREWSSHNLSNLKYPIRLQSIDTHPRSLAIPDQLAKSAGARDLVPNRLVSLSDG